jgi:hypothetical protein
MEAQIVGPAAVGRRIAEAVRRRRHAGRGPRGSGATAGSWRHWPHSRAMNSALPRSSRCAAFGGGGAGLRAACRWRSPPSASSSSTAAGKARPWRPSRRRSRRRAGRSRSSDRSCLRSLTVNDGVFSSWNGQRPTCSAPAFFSATTRPTTPTPPGARERRSRAGSHSRSKRRPCRQFSSGATAARASRRSRRGAPAGRGPSRSAAR